ncbi:hypothetical protein L9F63_014411, partial [Diploptera punctata]
IEKQNMFNYWIPVTLKTFPSLLKVLLEHLINASDNTYSENTIFSIINLLKLGRKDGSLLNVWSEDIPISSLTYTRFFNLLTFALEHSNETIRGAAFAIVCCCTKTSAVPRLIEFELVKTFLIKNVNIDDALLRQSILNSFTIFFMRVLSSSLFQIKQKNKQNMNKQEAEFSSCEKLEYDISQNIDFFEWLYYFLILNLEPGVNYQRKVLCLQLFKLILSSFGEASQKLKHNEKLSDEPTKEKIIEYASRIGKWHFNSTECCRILLGSVLDPTDDIREIAAIILIEHFSLREIPNESRGLLNFALKLCKSSVFYETESGALLFKVIASWIYRTLENISHNFVKNITEIRHEKYVNEIGEGKSNCEFKSSNYGCFESTLILHNQERLLVAIQKIVNMSCKNDQISKLPTYIQTYFGLCPTSEIKHKNIVQLSEEKVDSSSSSGTNTLFNPLKQKNNTNATDFKKVENICVTECDNIVSQNDDEVKEKCIHAQTGNSSAHPDISLESSDACRTSVIHTHSLEEASIMEDIYSSAAPLSVFLLSEAEKELICMKNDIFEAVATGSPLHGTLVALAQLSTYANGPEFEHMSIKEIERTVNLLDQTVSYLLDLLAAKSLTSNDIAPSFAEMDEAIKYSIEKSIIFSETAKEEMNLSPAHQLVLNCIWRNLKICCTLASNLPCNKECNIAVVRCCASVITQILTRCRHKGAIESAGVAFSCFVKNVKSWHKDVHLLLRDLLEQFLQSFESSSGKGSVTRRSAGLSILVQKIVTSDTEPGKPLLEMCVSRLLEIAVLPISNEITADPSAVLIDLPQAQSLHFLRILVQDASLKQDIAPFMSSIAILCFKYFTSPVWTIRNAALQLSGNLIPKLVGQKKVQDEEITLGSNISVESFFSHFPDFTDYIITSLQKAVNCDQSIILQQHSDVIPMLSLLAKVTVSIEEFITIPLSEKIHQCCECFLKLLSSPIYHVRKLAAKAYERFVPFTQVYNTIIFLVKELNIHNNCNKTNCSCAYKQNRVNGILLALKYLVEKLKFESGNKTYVESCFMNVGTSLKNIIEDDKICHLYTYFNKLLFIEVMDIIGEIKCNHDFAHQKIMQVYAILENEKFKPSFRPGLYLWAGKIIEQTIKKCSTEHLVMVWNSSYMLFNIYPEIFRTSCNSLKWRIEADEDLKECVKSALFVSVLKILLESNNTHVFYLYAPLFDVMIALLHDSEANVVITLKNIQTLRSNCLKDNVIALPIITGVLSRYLTLQDSSELCMSDVTFILELVNYIKEKNELVKYDEDFQLNIAKSLNFLAPCLQLFASALKNCEVNSKEGMLKDIIIGILCILLDLLQDEDFDVRKECAKYIILSENTDKPLVQNPYSALEKILQPSVLLSLLPVGYAIEFLWCKLCYVLDLQNIVKKMDKISNIMNPFDLGVSNIYCEQTKMIDLFGNSLLHILRDANPLEKRKLESIIYDRSLSFKDDVSTIYSLLHNVQKYGIPSSCPEHTIIYIVAKKMVYFSKLLAILEMASDVESLMQDLKSELFPRIV